MSEGEEGSIISYSSNWGRDKMIRAKGYTGANQVLDNLSRLPLGDQEAEVREKLSKLLIEALAVCRNGGAFSKDGAIAAGSASEMSLDSRYRALIERVGIQEEPMARAKGHIINLPESSITELQTVHFYAPNLMSRLGYWTSVGGSHQIFVDSRGSKVSVEKGLARPIENYMRHGMKEIPLSDGIKLPFKSLAHQALLDICRTEGLNKTDANDTSLQEPQ